MTVFATDRWITPLVSTQHHLTRESVFKHAGLHLKQVTPWLLFVSFCFSFCKYSDIKIPCQTFDNDILESCGNDKLCAALLECLQSGRQSDLSRPDEELTRAFWEWKKKELSDAC